MSKNFRNAARKRSGGGKPSFLDIDEEEEAKIVELQSSDDDEDVNKVSGPTPKKIQQGKKKIIMIVHLLNWNRSSPTAIMTPINRDYNCYNRNHYIF
jgi:hypothetical protein